MTKKIRYSEFTTQAPPPLTRFTPKSSPAVHRESPAPAAAPSPAAVPPASAQEPAQAPTRSEPKLPRVSTPVELARALSMARGNESLDATERLAQVEARAAAAHARELAYAEATAESGAPSAALLSSADAQRRSAERLAFEIESEPEWDDEVDEPRAPRRPLRERARARDGLAELLMFRIGTERFAVELASVEEAIDLPDVHHVPEMPPAMLGVITVREMLTPVFAPNTALGVPVSGRGAALIFRSDRGRFALAIDDVDDVLTLDLTLLREAPGSESGDGVVLGVARNEGAIVALVDADALVLACQAIPAMELA